MVLPIVLFLSSLAVLAAEVRAPAWIPEDAHIVVGFERPGELLVNYLQEALVFSLDLGDAHSGLLDRMGFPQGSGLERLTFVVLPLEGEGRGVVTIAQATAFPEDLLAQLPEPTSELRSEVLDRQTLVFGHPAAVAKLIEQRRSGGSTESSARVWGRITPAALALSKHASNLSAADVRGRSVTRSLFGIQEVSFFADVATEARFNLRARVADPADGLFLADALRGFLLPFQADSNDAVAVREALRRAAVSRQGDVVELTLPLTAEALERIRRNEATKRLLGLRLGPEVRERRQNLTAIIEALGVAEGSRVADVGAGDGFFTVRLAWLLGSAGRVYAVDIDEKALSSLRERIRAAPFDNVELVLGQADDPQLPAATLDAVLIVNSYHEMPQHQSMLGHIHEALKPGGRLVLVEPFSAARRALPREEQEKKHEIAPELVEEDLRLAGFRVASRNEELTPLNDEGARDFLVLAVKPSQMR